MRAIDLLGSILIYGVAIWALYKGIEHQRRRRAELRKEVKEDHERRMEELEKESQVFKQQLEAYEREKSSTDATVENIEKHFKKD